MTAHDFWYCIGDTAEIPNLYFLIGLVVWFCTMPVAWEELTDVEPDLSGFMLAFVIASVFGAFWPITLALTPIYYLGKFIIQRRHP